MIQQLNTTNSTSHICESGHKKNTGQMHPCGIIINDLYKYVIRKCTQISF